MNRIGLDPRLPTVSMTDQYLRLLNIRLTEFLRQIAISINQGSDGILYRSVTVTGDYTVQQADQVVICKPSGAMAITLLSPKATVNKKLTIKKANNSAHNITVSAPTGNIDGAASKVVSTAYDSIDLVSDGVDYWIC